MEEQNRRYAEFFNLNILDEQTTALGILAKGLKIFREKLLENGFTKEEAMRLCVTYLSALFAKGKK